jgi:hypothetical protein
VRHGSTFLRILLEAAVDTFKADFGFVYVPEGNALALAAACAWDRGDVDPPCETLHATGWSRDLHHASSESSSLPLPLAQAARGSGLESWWALPLEGESGLRGLLLLAWEAFVEIHRRDRDRAEAMTKSLGIVLERIRNRPGRDARARDR